MDRVISCLTQQHDYHLVLLAVLVCAVSTFTAFSLYERTSQARGFKRTGWLFLTGFVTGAGIWATHFIAMLAYDPLLPTAYEPGLTVLSLAIAIVVTAAGFTLAGIRDSRLPALAGGGLIGAGIASMHYTGMAAFLTEGKLQWYEGLVTASVAYGVIFGAAAILANRAIAGLTGRLTAAGLLTLAICAMHFTAMGALVIVPDPTIYVPDSMMDNTVMALAVAGVTSLVLLAGLAAAVMDSQSTRESIARLQQLVEAAIEGLVMARDGEILNLNRQITEMSGFTSEDLHGKSVFGDLLEMDGTVPELNGTHTLEAMLKPASGEPIPVEVVRRPYSFGFRGNEVYAIRDLRERRAAEARIRYLAHHDSLTGLPNRSALNSILEEILRQAHAAGHQFAVLCLDLDRFKDVNDVFGHGTGDAVLQKAAERMTAMLGEGEFIGRTGGDEFVIVQSGKAQPKAAGALAGRLIDTLEQSFDAGGQLTKLGVSIGIAVYPANGESMDELIANGDIALYRAKSAGRGCACFFEQEMNIAHRRRRRLSQALQAAVAGGELELEYQPQVRLDSGGLIGFEALVRWRHPEQGLISPSEFIPIAEETGVIIAVGEWVLKEACREAATWERPYKVAVNLSPRQFQMGDIVQLVHRTLLETGLAPERLELEITESTLFEDKQRALDILRRLKALGVTIAMDDFGTGYSSLSTLQSFPFDKIKIDRTFVDSLGKHSQAASIVRSVLGLGKSLDIPVLAEGVETEDQLGFLSAEMCAEVQGFFFGRPGTAEDVRALIRQATKDGALIPAGRRETPPRPAAALRTAG